ncbi:MAG: CoA ester lyase [Sphingomonas sp.]|nr:CoA ester lyase [Sphingomonas sp.]
MTDPIRPCRSALFLPASNPRAIEKARGLPCDAVILDLEDAVAPNVKAAARAAAVAAFTGGGFGGRLTVLRVNALDTPWGADDLKATAGLAVDAVLAPKVATAADVARYRERLAGQPLWVMIETCRALANLQAIADAVGAGGGMVIGTNDLALEMRCAGRAPLVPVLTLAVAAARASGLVALDGVRNDFRDLDALRAEAEQGRDMGFDGKTLIHPAQIEPCNAAFTPSAEQVARADAIVAAFAAPEHVGRGAIQIDGRMVERLHLAEAQRTLALCAAANRGYDPAQIG